MFLDVSAVNILTPCVIFLSFICVTLILFIQRQKKRELKKNEPSTKIDIVHEFKYQGVKKTHPTLCRSPEENVQNEILEKLLESDDVRETVEKLLSFDSQLAREEIISLIKNIHSLSLRKLTNDKIYSNDVMDFLFNHTCRQMTFVHYTADEDVARNIINYGFRYSTLFSNTARQLSEDLVDFNYKHREQQYFGNYIVVIGISETLKTFYENEFQKRAKKFDLISDILSEPCHVPEEDDEFFLVLSKEYVKGYVNYETGQVVLNSYFNPDFNPDYFINKVQLL